VSPASPPALDRATLDRHVHELASREAVFARILRRWGQPPLWNRRPGFATLAWIILGQQVSVASANAAYRRLVDGAGRVTPARVLALAEDGLRALGITRQKARYCVCLAREVEAGRLALPALEALSADEVRDRLTSVTGIGRWSADIYRLMALGDPDVWPRGDVALYGAWRVEAGVDWSAEAIDRHARRWRPFRSAAARLLWHRVLSRRRQRRRGAGGRYA
jgi:DNA-3-methyladenine glycosylase II